MRPYLTIAAACSLDGKITTVQRDPVTFPSAEDRQHLFRLRDSVDAILTGAATVRAEDPPLLPDAARRQQRVSAGLSADPLRIVVSRSLDFKVDGRAFRARDGAPIVALTIKNAPREAIAACEKAGIEVLRFSGEDVPLGEAMTLLRREYGVKSVLSEGGGVLTSQLLARGLVDELWVTLCPVILGGRMAPTLCDGAGFTLDDAPRLELVEQVRGGAELFLRYRVKRDGRTPMVRNLRLLDGV